MTDHCLSSPTGSSVSHDTLLGQSASTSLFILSSILLYFWKHEKKTRAATSIVALSDIYSIKTLGSTDVGESEMPMEEPKAPAKRKRDMMMLRMDFGALV